MTVLQLIALVASVAAVAAVLATTAVGFALGHLVEKRLKAMRELFSLALVQRDSFDASTRGLADRIDGVHSRIDIIRKEHSDTRATIEGHEARIARLEGKRTA